MMMPANEVWVERARAVRIEDEIARRGIKLRGTIDRCGPCPKCGGDDRFSINTKKQVFNCRGCGAKGDVIDLVQHLDAADFITACTTLNGSPAPQMNGHAVPKPKKVTGARYNYYDEAGTLLFMVVRVEFQNSDGSFVLKNGKRAKTFGQARPDPNCAGNWLYNVDGIRTVPYRLPELIEAIAQDRPVFVVEGEQKADALAEWNLHATCNAGGAKKWTAQHAAYLRGADVIILPDNDPSGREHAQLVAHSLVGIARRIRVLELPAVEPKSDIVDWQRSGHTREQFDALLEHAPDWKPATERETTAANGGSMLEWVRADEIVMTAVSWLWPGRFAIGKLGIIAGLPDEGKGQVLCDIAARVTRGEDWPCNEGTAPKGSVILLTAEDDPRDTVVPRLAAAGADLSRIYILEMARDGDRERTFSLITDLELLRQKIRQVGDVHVVQIDPISAYMGVGKIDSYRTTDVRAVLAPLVALTAELQVSVIGILHFNKKVDINNALLRISDSLAYGATARHVYGVVNDSENKRKLFVRAKNNLAASADKALSYGFGARCVGTDPKSGKEIWAPHIVWGNEYVDVTAAEAMQAAAESRSPAARDGAKKFLTEILAAGPVLKKDIEEAAEANGIADRTLRRAQTELGVVAKKDGPGGAWRWHAE